VKNLYLGRERTLARKLTEAVLTWRLEQRLSKTRILEAYLNVIELGASVYGIGPAAMRWFGKAATRLVPAEAAYLAATTAAPTTAESVLKTTGRPDADVVRRAQIVLSALRSRLGASAYEHAVHDLGKLRPGVR
jgi:monofunctional glycosyltransferase